MPAGTHPELVAISFAPHWTEFDAFSRQPNKNKDVKTIVQMLDFKVLDMCPPGIVNVFYKIK